jgi:hypothetical protein
MHRHGYALPVMSLEWNGHTAHAADASSDSTAASDGVTRHSAGMAPSQPVAPAAWRTKPSYAILTTQDHVISPELQRWVYERSGAKVTEVSASHAGLYLPAGRGCGEGGRSTGLITQSSQSAHPLPSTGVQSMCP